jgi:hypothetical protein
MALQLRERSKVSADPGQLDCGMASSIRAARALTCSDVNPTVEAAWIAAGVAGLGIAGTVTVAITQARLHAYASDEVWEAFEATRQADLGVWGRYRQWKMLADDNRLAVESGRPGAATDGQTTTNARRAVNPAVEEAETRDEAVIKLIGDELRSEPASTSTALEPSTHCRRRRDR